MKKLLVAAAVGAMASLAVAAPALAEEPTPDCRTVVGDIADRPDSGLHGNWAKDNFKRTVKICAVLPEAEAQAVVPVEAWQYTAVGTDVGTFTTTGPNSPSAGTPLSAGLTGKLSGEFSLKFTAPANWLGFTEANKNSNQFATSEWLKKLWTDGYTEPTNFKWAWTYTLCNEKWTNASTGNEGDITGKSRKACPEATFVDDCNGTKVTLKNNAPSANSIAWFKIGDAYYKVAGGSSTVVNIPSSDMEIVVYAYGGAKEAQQEVAADSSQWKKILAKHTWVKPKTCTPPTPNATPTQIANPNPEPTLPVTGANVPIVIGTGGALTLAGVVILVATRKRRRNQVEFTNE